MTNQQRVDALSPVAREIFDVLDKAAKDWLAKGNKYEIIYEQDISAGIELFRQKIMESFFNAYEEDEKRAMDN